MKNNRYILFLLLLFASSGTIVEAKLAQWSMSNQSLEKQFNSTLSCKSAPSQGSFQNCQLNLIFQGQAVTNAKINIGGGMPAHQHGLPTAPLVKWSDTDKSYKIEGLKFSMPGEWVLHFYIDEGGTEKSKKISYKKDIISFSLTI